MGLLKVVEKGSKPKNIGLFSTSKRAENNEKK